MHFSNFLNFCPLNNSLELWTIFSRISLPKGMFWENKKKFDFRECLSILDILRKWLLIVQNPSLRVCDLLICSMQVLSFQTLKLVFCTRDHTLHSKARE